MNYKEFLNRILDKKVNRVIASVLASIALWVYVSTTEGVEKEETFYGVQVNFVNAEEVRESSGLIVTSQDIQSVDLTLSGPMRQITRLTNDNITLTIDLSKAVFGNNRSAYEIHYPSDVDSSSLRRVNASAYIVNFYLDKLVNRRFEVKGTFTGSAEEGYIAEDPVFNPLTVNISGPQTSIDKVDHAWVEITRETVDRTLQYNSSYVLRDKDNQVISDELLIMDTPEVEVTLSVLTIKNVPLSVTLIDGGGATGEEHADVKIEPAVVQLAGDAAVMDGLNKLTIATIDLADFASSFEDTYTLALPNDTECLSGTTEAKVTVTIKGLVTRKMTLTQFDCINVADGYTADVITESLTVNVRAPESIINSISAENLYAVVDMQEVSASAGTFNPVARIRIDGYPTAGAVGEYKVFVTQKALY
ncbi:MAG: CdaR family protein [Eubacteriales bacterium]|nr:CdaR family protein [Eubacteriales bacterium]